MSGPIAYYEVRWRPSDSDGEWSVMTAPADSSTISIKGVDRSKVYVIQARSVGPTGLKSIWVDISHTVASNNYCQVPQSMDADGMADAVRIMWTFPNPLHADIDVCIERSTSASGPFVEVARVRSDYVVIQELVDGTFYYRARTKNFREQYSAYSTTVSGSPLTTAELQSSIASALAAATAAQDTADGKIDSFFQPSPPSEASLGDLWFDTDDNNKIYRYNGSSWVVSQDTGIPLAIANAAGAQATADSKVRTFYSTTTPTATGLGDLWYNDSTKVVLRWNGSSWVKISEVASAVISDFIVNGSFTQNFEYWTVQAQWATGTTSGYLSTNHAIATGSVGTPDSRISCDRIFTVLPGEAYVLSAMCLNTNSPNGDLKIGLVLFDSTGSQIGTSEASIVPGTSWARQKAVISIPASGVAAARVTVARYGHTTGEYHVYDVKVSRLAADSSELLLGIGKNMIPNSEFGGRTGSYSPWANTWNPAGGTFSIANRLSGLAGGSTWTVDGDYGQLSVYRGARGTGTPAVFDVSNNANPTIPVEPGARYEFNARVAAHRCAVSMVVGWFDSSGAYISEAGTAYYGPGGSFATGIGGKNINDYTQIGSFAIAPSNARTARVWFSRTDTNVGEIDSYLWILQPYFGRAGVNQIHYSLYNPGPNLDADGIGTGAQAGVVSISDLHNDGGLVRRIGLRVGDSGHRLGNQRNNVRSSTSAYGMTRNTSALTATSAGAVSVNAHTCKYGGFSVSYNAVTNAVTGLTQNVKYVIYCLDADLSGGTKTYYAGTNPDTVMNISDDVYVVGEILIPTSGTSSGGSGSSGGGDTWCVAIESFLPDGTLAGDVIPNYSMPCYNHRANNPNIFHWPVQANHISESECLRMVTESGASLIASVTTPMTLENDQCVFLPDMLHRKALVYRRNGSFRWEYVVELTPVGVRPVAKIHVHNQCYFSGETMDAFIATHNSGVVKP